MGFSTQFCGILIICIIVVALIIVFTALVIWARKGNKGANLVAATFAFLAPDPTFEKNIKIIKESENQVKSEERESQEIHQTLRIFMNDILLPSRCQR